MDFRYLSSYCWQKHNHNTSTKYNWLLKSFQTTIYFSNTYYCKCEEVYRKYENTCYSQNSSYFIKRKAQTTCT